ncbi:hypothetical protein KKG66_08170 [bacterium]|nr:hypothetical protein [bacterium]
MKSKFKNITPTAEPVRRLILCVIMTLAITVSGNAQTDLKQEIDSLFAAGEFEQVELIMLRLGNEQGELTDAEFASMKTTAGFAMIMLDRETDARQYFREALAIDPNLTLDPVMISPKFRVVFDDVKAALQSVQAEPEKKIYRGARPSSHILNLILPGAGQLREGNLRGTVYLAAQAATLYLLIDQLDKTSDSRAFYLAQTERSAMARAYDDYNNDYKTAWKYGLLSGAVYFASQIDLACFHQPLAGEEHELSFFLLPAKDRLVFQVNW